MFVESYDIYKLGGSAWTRVFILRSLGWRACYYLPDGNEVLQILCDEQSPNPNVMYIVTLAIIYLTLQNYKDYGYYGQHYRKSIHTKQIRVIMWLHAIFQPAIDDIGRSSL